MDIRQEFYRKLDYDKIQINRNENPIKMKLFLSFLTIDVERITDHLGSCTGWTKLINKEHKLEIGGGIVSGVEYLDSLRYKKDLHNQHNNWVTPFNMFELLTKRAKLFFFEYYEKDIELICKDADQAIKNLQAQIKQAKEIKKGIQNEISFLKDPFQKL